MAKPGCWVEITDVGEMQNLLDDFSSLRPRLNVYTKDPIRIYAPEWELDAWRDSSERVHRSVPQTAEQK